MPVLKLRKTTPRLVLQAGCRFSVNTSCPYFTNTYRSKQDRMKHSLLIAALLLVCASPVFPQSGSTYRVDNFDFGNAVRVMTPPPAASSPMKSRRGKLRGGGYSASAGSINAII